MKEATLGPKCLGFWLQRAPSSWGSTDAFLLAAAVLLEAKGGGFLQNGTNQKNTGKRHAVPALVPPCHAMDF